MTETTETDALSEVTITTDKLPTASSNKSPLSAGAIIGISVASAVVIGVCVGVAYKRIRSLLKRVIQENRQRFSGIEEQGGRVEKQVQEQGLQIKKEINIVSIMIEEISV